MKKTAEKTSNFVTYFSLILEEKNFHFCIIYNEYNIICRKYKAWLKDTLHHRSQYTTLCWTSAIALLINAIILVIAFFTIDDTRYELNKLCIKIQ